jgi:hypothetical protein
MTLAVFSNRNGSTACTEAREAAMRSWREKYVAGDEVLAVGSRRPRRVGR